MAILVAIGDDDRSEPVLRVAARFAEGMRQELIAVHVTTDKTASGDDRDLRDEIRSVVSEAGVQADVTLEHLNRSGLRPGTAIGKQLVEMAEGVEIEQIVLGYRQKNQLAELREGHTGFVVAQEATVPVTIVPEAVSI